MMKPGGKSAAGQILTNIKHKKMDDITKGLQGAIIVAVNYQKWRKGEIEELIYSPKVVSMALNVVVEAAKALLVLEQIKNGEALKRLMQKND